MTNKILVWDIPTRLFHWFLVLALFAAWYTSDGEKGLIDIHLIVGYVILGLISFRLIWGVFGTKYARFSQFFPTIKRLQSYRKQSNQLDENIGHNPVGALMVFFMLVLILSQGISGLFMNDDVFTTGPYYSSVDSSVQSFMSFIHRNFFDVIIAAAALHILAALYYLFVKKLNLIIPMITGYKHTKSAENGIRSSKLVLALIVAVIVAAFLYWLLVINVPVEEEFYF